MQIHHQRADYWVVVHGTAKAVNCESELILAADQSANIPVGVKHRLSNPSSEVLELIEVQLDSYLGEDDTVRFDGVY